MPGVSKALDQIDEVIIGLLRKEGRMSWRELGEFVHLSATSVGDRVRRLEREGFISGYRALISPQALGKDLAAVVELSLRPDVVPEDFERELAKQGDVSFAAYVTGVRQTTPCFSTVPAPRASTDSPAGARPIGCGQHRKSGCAPPGRWLSASPYVRHLCLPATFFPQTRRGCGESPGCESPLARVQAPRP